MKEDPRFNLAREVADQLNAAGYTSLFAGGCVRDLVRDRPPKDYDIATDATPEAIMDLFPKAVPVGAAFGVILVVWKEAPFEVATFRSDGAYLDGRHPSSVKFGNAREDALRRDFTINGLFMDPATGQIIDHVGGVKDIEKKIIRSIGDPDERFGEDRLRLLRAVRFHVNLGFSICPETLDALKRRASEIQMVSGERIRDEMFKILTGPAPHEGLRVLESTGILEAILPEVVSMKGVEQPREFHPEGDVWTHTLLMLEKMEDPTPELAMGVLLHDVGKPITFAQAEGDRIRFNRHDEVGARMTREICRRLRLSRAESRHVEALVAEHMHFLAVPKMRESTCRRFLNKERIEDHLELHRLDCLSSHGNLDIHAFCTAKLAEVGNQPILPPSLLNGDDLIELGFAPGPVFSEILKDLLDKQMENRIKDREEARVYVLDTYGERRIRTE